MSASRYSDVAIVLHWAIAILIIGQILGGLYMDSLPNEAAAKFDLFQLHKSFGLSILILTIFRLAWRALNPPPALPAEMPGWQKGVARATHWAFYGFLFATPLAGWIMVSVSPLGIDTYLFGIVPVPHLPFFSGGDAEATENTFKLLHRLLAFSMGGLLIVHIGAALKHHFVDRDEVFTSMAPRTGAQWLSIGAVLGAMMLGVAVYFLAPPPGAQAAAIAEQAGEGGNWIVDAEASKLVFIGEEKGRSFEGEFEDFSAEITFDPENLGDASIKAIVATGSAVTGEMTRDATITDGEWFDSGSHAAAIFASTAVRETGDGAYEMDGTLTIKEFSKALTIPFSLSIDGDNAIAKGGVDLVRTDFGLGERGYWLDEERVALKVRVEFEITATRR